MFSKIVKRVSKFAVCLCYSIVYFLFLGVPHPTGILWSAENEKG